MVTNEVKPREVGRPRIFADDAIFLATARALSRLGYGRLTLDEIAGELGCTRQALVRRFGSKHGLVRAYLIWVVDHAAARYQEIRQTYSSPLAALRARFLLPAEDRPDEIADPGGQANLLSFFIGARDDPEFRELVARLQRTYDDEVARLLQEAQAAGELIDADAYQLAHTLIVAVTGEIVFWAANPEGQLVPRIARVFDAVLQPYVTARP